MFSLIAWISVVASACAFLSDFAESELARQSNGMREVFRKNLPVNVAASNAPNDISDSAWQSVATDDIVDVALFFQLNDSFVFVTFKRTALPAFSLPRAGGVAPRITPAALAGLPDGASHPLRINTEIFNVTVVSNVPCVPVGLRPSVYFIAHEDCYGPSRSFFRPGGSATLYDHDDWSSFDGGACFGQIFLFDVAQGEGIFAFSGFASGSVDDLGLCTQKQSPNATTMHPSWTHARNSASYATRQLQIFFRLQEDAVTLATTAVAETTTTLSTQSSTRSSTRMSSLATSTNTSSPTSVLSTSTLSSTAISTVFNSTTSAGDLQVWVLGLIVGGAIGAVLLVGLMIYLIRRRHRRAQQQKPATAAAEMTPRTPPTDSNYASLSLKASDYDSGRMVASHKEYDVGRI
jgi:hypothetical protein